MVKEYSLAARIMHWFMAVVIIALLTVGYFMTSMPASPLKWELYGMHKATGVVALVLIALRIFYRLFNQYPELPKGTPKLNIMLAKSNYLFLYILMLVMPASGLLGSLLAGYNVSVFDLFLINGFEKNIEIAKIMWQIHGICFYCFLVSISAHLLGAIYHHFIIKDNLVTRMIRGS